MENDASKKVAMTLAEEPLRMRVGVLRLSIKPLTLAQIYAMGAIAEQINEDGLGEREQVFVLAEITAHYKDALLMQDIFIECAFREAWKKRLFGWYIRKKLTLRMMQQLLEYISQTFDANFFLTSIIFLRKTTTITKPKKTTALGQQSEE